MKHNSHNESSVNHCLVFDPIPFFGGSKVATQEMLNQCNSNDVLFTVLTVNPSCWQHESSLNSHQIKLIHLKLPQYLFSACHGGLFWIKQVYFALMLLITLCRVRHVNTAVGMSGPGIDMALYLIKPFYHFQLIQLIHGPVACSRSIGYCLAKADLVFALESVDFSVNAAFVQYFKWRVNGQSAKVFARFTLSSPRYQFFTNGISDTHWPTSCTYGEPRLFWAASLLKWKGLETLIDAGKRLAKTTPIPIEICYIKPERTALDISHAPVAIPYFSWHQNPRNLDEVRAQSNIFVSTSQNEPFGLSILEAMAAGMCVLIPRDDAYWDKILTHNVNCIKYQPNSSYDLFLAITRVIQSPDLIPILGRAAQTMANNNYRAELSYEKIVYAISSSHTDAVIRD